MSRSRRPRGARAAALALVLALVGLLGGAFVTGRATSAAAADTVPGWTATRTITREHLAADGSTEPVDSRTVTVAVDRTQDLRGRERVAVTWTGARPSAGRTVSPYGYDGTNQEYPVVILQCRGLDDPTLPVAQQLSPETCWTSTYLQRIGQASPASAVWRHDRYATDAERGDQSTAVDWPEACAQLPPSLLSQRLVPFRAANGTVYPSCSDTTIAPESAVDAALPAAELAAFTRSDGTGEANVEIRTATENESLGCSTDVPCSLVVIPIMGISCLDGDATCRGDGSFEAGSSNFGNLGVDDAVSARYWWSASNWRNRFAAPLSFALPPDACDVLDDRAPVDMYGSELLNQASLQWAPAYCLRADRFKFRHNRMSESSALRLLGSGGAVAAFVSEPAQTSTVPLGYAPVAVTGFAVAYVADLPDNAGEVQDLRLTPRLLAKLLTQSYPASSSGQAHPGMADNPLALNTDPEFTELNPGLSLTAEEARATMLSLSEQSDVMTALTAYIAADTEAMAFVHGEADPWGMVVNPSYKDIALPRADWPMLDTFVRDINRECEKLNPSPYLGLVAAPVTRLRTVAEAVLDAWPNVQTQCTRSTTSDPWKFGRIARQGYGSRFMLGLVSLGDAERFGLRTAALRTAGTGPDATFVEASPASMASALTVADQTAPGAPFLLDRTALPADAYPGTMVVHAAAALSGLSASDAGHVAELVRIATTEGQVPGSGNGQLPDGYLPITSDGPTAALLASAQAVASAIEAQSGPMVVPVSAPVVAAPVPHPVGAAAAFPTASARAPANPFLAAATGPVPTTGLAADKAPETAQARAAGTTIAERSGTANAALPTTLSVALGGAVGAPLLRLFTTRRRSA
ncbi:hypothetical protein [Cellulomonas soli]|uniref:Uncharacterized protein n=1 Tax=Cellulomonas soli TaxID=931535 RepID=A0A512PF15_9CELL|nr:hypothetical protein [Cellulomonas soli]NYI59419.1 hypothetical protein [Cellulomonas soli]GEP69789.1 hypothetical protein CSO01_25040 [Cellulomonas soli]